MTMKNMMKKMNPFRKTIRSNELKTDYTHNHPTTTINPDWMLSHPYVDKQAKHPNNNEYTFEKESYKPSGEEHVLNTNWMFSHPYVTKVAGQPRPQKNNDDEDTIASQD